MVTTPRVGKRLYRNRPQYLEPGRRTDWTGPAVYTYHNTNLFTAHERFHFSAAMRTSIYDMPSNERFRSIASDSSCSHYLASYFLSQRLFVFLRLSSAASFVLHTLSQ